MDSQSFPHLGLDEIDVVQVRVDEVWHALALKAVREFLGDVEEDSVLTVDRWYGRGLFAENSGHLPVGSFPFSSDSSLASHAAFLSSWGAFFTSGLGRFRMEWFKGSQVRWYRLLALIFFVMSYLRRSGICWCCLDALCFRDVASRECWIALAGQRTHGVLMG